MDEFNCHDAIADLTHKVEHYRGLMYEFRNAGRRMAKSWPRFTSDHKVHCRYCNGVIAPYPEKYNHWHDCPVILFERTEVNYKEPEVNPSNLDEVHRQQIEELKALGVVKDGDPIYSAVAGEEGGVEFTDLQGELKLNLSEEALENFKAAMQANLNDLYFETPILEVQPGWTEEKQGYLDEISYHKEQAQLWQDNYVELLNAGKQVVGALAFRDVECDLCERVMGHGKECPILLFTGEKPLEDHEDKE
jgi:hypothetical protein